MARISESLRSLLNSPIPTTAPSDSTVERIKSMDDTLLGANITTSTASLTSGTEAFSSWQQEVASLSSKARSVEIVGTILNNSASAVAQVTIELGIGASSSEVAQASWFGHVPAAVTVASGVIPFRLVIFNVPSATRIAVRAQAQNATNAALRYGVNVTRG